jgi:hypothetical protein
MTLENMWRCSGDIGAMACDRMGSSIEDEKSQVYVQCVEDRDFRETPKPFVIEGRPHIDEKRKFKLLHTPVGGSDYTKMRGESFASPRWLVIFSATVLKLLFL